MASDEAWADLARRMRAEHPVLADGAPNVAMAQGTSARLGVSLFNLLVTALSGVVLFRLALRLCGAVRPAWLAALMWGAATMAWPHSRTFFSEPLAGLCLLVSLGALARYFHSEVHNATTGATDDTTGGAAAPDEGHGGRRDELGWGELPFFAGLVAAYGCLVRLDSAVFLPGLALLVAWGDFSAENFAPQRAGAKICLLARHLFRARVLARLVVFALPAAAAGGVILWLNAAHFGHPFATAYSDQPEGVVFSTPILAGIYGFLMSVGKGMFFFSPALVLCFWGFRPMLRRRPVFGLAVVVLVVSFFLFQSRWRNWAGGWCWGPRHVMQIHALLAVPIAFWLAERWNAVRRVAVICLLAAGGAVQVYGCSENFIEFYRIYYQDPRPPNAQPLYDLQSSPELAYQYAVFLRDQQGKPAMEISLTDLPAPINDSIYIVQNSQWLRYAEMLCVLRLHDFFWLHLLEKPADTAPPAGPKP